MKCFVSGLMAITFATLFASASKCAAAELVAAKDFPVGTLITLEGMRIEPDRRPTERLPLPIWRFLNQRYTIDISKDDVLSEFYLFQQRGQGPLGYVTIQPKKRDLGDLPRRLSEIREYDGHHSWLFASCIDDQREFLGQVVDLSLEKGITICSDFEGAKRIVHAYLTDSLCWLYERTEFAAIYYEKCGSLSVSTSIDEVRTFFDRNLRLWHGINGTSQNVVSPLVQPEPDAAVRTECSRNVMTIIFNDKDEGEAKSEQQK